MVLIATIGVAAQDRPDFSGQWMLVTTQPRADGETASALSVHYSIVQTTLRGEPTRQSNPITN